MERPMGIEPTPKAWQAFVLPLYYGRFAPLFYSTPPGRPTSIRPARVTPDRPKKKFAQLNHSRYLGDAGSLYDGRPLLPFGKAGGFVVVCVHAAKPLSIRVEHGNEPVMMLATPIFPKG